jgi:hypothetical protein
MMASLANPDWQIERRGEERSFGDRCDTIVLIVLGFEEVP